ncbi:16S rRNA (guanine(966)-N(2))-methyltransferase RsmD [Synechococcus sp. HJ21-Hayes]|jgi:16S rRNA (guanine(966)-N(2))-methyltransferase RsmD|uniref:16S rRNA (guanine(966)-N(2))-methyltransferase RsmD n=1 Tax=unclassified Synechococcus TaxID=2626047 RepID=UPI0020CFBD49|nr:MULTISPECIES: 16S rRNA (guanine(966)-N(2))-methyltransferase RsmD [unclassified Synechococcus]MCP9832311.1 16S rRNA (guanine(966)-N(2))-methyltransferase RsmD [Synechococcus sp. JJ3a-Johnson]MCP9853572.1 16S rRNA (guanine(966)-N(2))-methyltransferase RsmD [Synechococcus sp. HJ21-Hayes]
MSLRLSGGRKLQSPPGSLARPTPSRVRLAVMNMLATELPGAFWLDLFCGSGVMGCEALQKGAAAVVAVDQDRRMQATTRKNLEAVARGLPQPVAVEVVAQEVLRWLGAGALERCSGSPMAQGFDLIYADPPYSAELYGAVAAAVMQGSWLKPGGLLLWEHATMTQPEVPPGWIAVKHKRYGTSSVLMLKQRKTLDSHQH